HRRKNDRQRLWHMAAGTRRIAVAWTRPEAADGTVATDTDGKMIASAFGTWPPAPDASPWRGHAQKPPMA
ncbi:hypothetical protein CKJ89_39310, partial [Klebsiella pneumoniae]